MFSARKQVLKIFEHIRVFKMLKNKAKNLISVHLDFEGDATTTTSKLRRVCKDVESCQKLLLEDIISLLKNYKQLGKRSFIFEKKEWLCHSVKEYATIKRNAEKVGIEMKHIKDLEAIKD